MKHPPARRITGRWVKGQERLDEYIHNELKGTPASTPGKQ
jgi:hypothetical protein